MHVGTMSHYRLVLISTTVSLVFLSGVTAFPTSDGISAPENAGAKPASVGRLAFTLADGDAGKSSEPQAGSFLDVIQAVAKSSLFQKFFKYLGGVVHGGGGGGPQGDEPRKVFAAPILPQADPVRANFEASLSHDDAIETVPSGSAIAAPSAHKSINDEAFTGLLFGEQGVLTNVFHMLDAQKQNDMASQAQKRAQAQADPSNAKIKDLDFAKIFDSLMMGGQKQNEFGEPGPELPEFLGICNRLSCGDIYKAIDEFRRSEFFSNFQTALQLIQDPKGWDILGKMLSNPEMIAQFTGGAGGGAVGAGIGQMFGSALGGAKQEVAKGETLEGDFGTDFSNMAKIDKVEMPETSFSIDRGHKGDGAGEDYYSEIVTNIDEDFEVEDKDILGVKTTTTARTTPAPTTTTAVFRTTTVTTPPIGAGVKKVELPETSFSIDGGAKGAGAGTDYYSEIVTNIDEDFEVEDRDIEPIVVTTRPTPTVPSSAPTFSSRTTSTVPSSTREFLLPKKEEPMPDIEFSIDEEDYGQTFEKSIDAVAPPAVTVDQKPPTVSNKPIEALKPLNGSSIATMSVHKTSELVIKGGGATATVPSTRATFTTRYPITTTVPTTAKATFTTTSTVPSSATPRLKMRRVSIAATVAPKNHRKDSDYYAMYYDN